MTQDGNETQKAEGSMPPDGYEKALSQIARATLITQASREYLHVAHNHIATISVMLSSLFQCDSVRRDKNAMELAHRITAEFECFRDIMQSLSSWYRPRPQMHARPLAECIRRLSEVFTSFLRRQSVALESHFSDEVGHTPVPVEVVSESAACVLRNSLDALQTVKGSRRVRMTANVIDDRLELKTEDNGPGISLELLPMVCNLGFTTRPGRAGLGLYLVKSMLQLVGGTVSVGNHLPHGATVVLSVPLNWREYQNEDNPVD